MFKNKRLLMILGAIAALAAVVLGVKFMRLVPKDTGAGQTKINIAYATDENYVLPTLVSIVSAMENADENSHYAFTVLLSGGISSEQKNKFKSIEKKYKNCSMNLIDMGSQFGDSEVKFWSRAMYYRLALHEILKDEKRCIYLDGDTIVRKDLKEMNSINMDDYYIAGVRDINIYINKDSKHYELIGIPNLNTYVCSGVLIMNLEKIRNDNLGDVFDRLVKENDKNKTFKFPDQDTLNKACYGHILTLPFKYGALAHTGFGDSYKDSEYAQWASNEKDWDEGRKDPTVLHFTGDKPWSVIYSDFCNEWWNYAEKTGFNDEISAKYSDVKVEKN